MASDKIVLMSTHDPILALLGERRIVVANGAVTGVVETGPDERQHLEVLERYDRALSDLREELRGGARINDLPPELAALASHAQAKRGLAWTR